MSSMSPSGTSPLFAIEQLDSIAPQSCPCGWTRRGFVGLEDSPASVHQVEILQDARTHYHKTMTEIYVVLEGLGEIELDGQRLPVKPMTSILIRPGCRHRAIGKLKILNIAIPRFDPGDEWFD
jgi:mannose-6-phosphate isomerase-like protein (cupin superfamily)